MNNKKGGKSIKTERTPGIRTRADAIEAFDRISGLAKDLFVRKLEGYNADGAPFENLRAVENVGVRSVVSAYARMADKMSRLSNHVRRIHEVGNENPVESHPRIEFAIPVHEAGNEDPNELEIITEIARDCIDLHNYAIIVLLLAVDGSKVTAFGDQEEAWMPNEVLRQ